MIGINADVELALHSMRGCGSAVGSNRVIRSALIAFAVLLSACITDDGPLDASKAVPKATVDITLVRNIVYTPAGWPQPLQADLYKPTGAGPFPAVVMIHGGGWGSRTRADMNSEARAAAKRGYIVLNVSHRFAPQWHFPAQLHDIQQAVLWLRANAAAQNVRADRVAVWGFSSGAHLGALVAVTGPEDKQFIAGTRVQAVVAGSIPADLRDYSDQPLVNDLMGVSYQQNPQLWREASPLALVTPDDPPMFIYHGTTDVIVSPRNAQTLYDVLKSVNVPAELYLVNGFGHYRTFFMGAPEPAIDFLDIHLR